jgi:acetylornithine deacetylase/succinyl-diaminopimelate desuccinylase-like protein
LDKAIIERVLNLAVEIQQIPSKTFCEQQRARFILDQFKILPVDDCFMDEDGNVFAHFKGISNRLPLVVSAHLDTVFPLETDLSITSSPERISGPGIGDNALGLAGLFGLGWALGSVGGEEISVENLPGDLWLVANIAEEGLGNLKGMHAVVNRFSSQVLAYVILEGMSLGQIYHRGLGVKRYRISVSTRGGHSWVDYGNPSAIHELADIVLKLIHLALPVEPRTTLNVGMISGGTSVNTIAAEASLELDLRSVSPSALDRLSSQVESLVMDADRRGGEAVRVQAKVIGDRPAGEIPADHPLVRLAVQCSEAGGVKTRLNIGSTDTNAPLSRGIPAVCMGLTTGSGAHTDHEYIDTAPVSQGLDILVNFVRSIYERGLSPSG